MNELNGSGVGRVEITMTTDPFTSGDTRSDVLAALAHDYRWQTLQQLAESDGGICTVKGAVEAIVTADDTAANTDKHERIRQNLYHTHLPKLADAGLIKYDWSTGDIVYTGDIPASALMEAAAKL